MHLFFPIDLIVRFDGSCWPNPGGDPKWGWHIDTPDGVRVAQGSGVKKGLQPGERTNNYAEYAGLKAALEWLSQFKLPIDKLTLIGDSQVVIRAFGRSKTHGKPHLERLRNQCVILLADLDVGDIEVVWESRENNHEADRLAAGAGR